MHVRVRGVIRVVEADAAQDLRALAEDGGVQQVERRHATEPKPILPPRSDNTESHPSEHTPFVPHRLAEIPPSRGNAAIPLRVLSPSCSVWEGRTSPDKVDLACGAVVDGVRGRLLSRPGPINIHRLQLVQPLLPTPNDGEHGHGHRDDQRYQHCVRRRRLGEGKIVDGLDGGGG
jgi:hypothetical protein